MREGDDRGRHLQLRQDDLARIQEKWKWKSIHKALRDVDALKGRK